MRRTIIVIVGQLRTAEINAKHLRDAITSLENPIIMVQCPKSDELRAKSIYDTSYVDGWDPDPKLPHWLTYSWPFLGNSGKLAIKEKPSFYYQLIRQKRAAEMFRPEVNLESDIIIKWRPDLRIFSKFENPSFLDLCSFYIPEHDNHGGYNDQCAAGSAMLMMKYLARIDQLRDYFSSGGTCHAETFLKWILSKTSIRPMPISYCIDRGTHFNPVKIGNHLGDTFNKTTVEVLTNHGVPVEQPVQCVSPNLKSTIASFFEYSWQSQVAARLCRKNLPFSR